MFVLVVAVDQDRGTVKRQSRSVVFVPVAVQRQGLRDGRKVTETVNQLVPETRTQQHELALKSLRVLDRDGKEVTGKDLWTRLNPGTMVLQQSGVQPVDAAYRRVLGREALILMPRKEGPQLALRSGRPCPSQCQEV